MPILAALSRLLVREHASYGPMGSPDFRSLRDNVFRAIENGELFDQACSIAAEFFDDDRMRAAAARLYPQPPGQITPATMMAMSTPLRAALYTDIAHEAGFAVAAVSAPTGEELTAVVLLNFLGGPIATDAYVTPVETHDVLDRIDANADLERSPKASSEVARVALDAIHTAKMSYPSIASDSWPDEAPLIDWIIGKIPNPAPPIDLEIRITEDERTNFISSFLASPEAGDVAMSEDRKRLALELVMFFKLSYGNGSQTLWGEQQVGYLMHEWLHSKVVGPDEDILDVFDLLPAIVRYSHRTTDVVESLTEHVLTTISASRPVAVSQLNERRPGGGGDPDLDMLSDFGSFDYVAMVRGELEDAVGGAAALDNLTVERLPANELGDGANLEDERLTHIVNAARTGARELFGDEMATAVSRLAIHLAGSIPKVLLRGRSESAAAAITLLSAEANNVKRQRTLKELQEVFGIKSSPSERASSISKAMGFRRQYYGLAALGSPRFLISSRRQGILDELAEIEADSD